MKSIRRHGEGRDHRRRLRAQDRGEALPHSKAGSDLQPVTTFCLDSLKVARLPVCMAAMVMHRATE